jgi:HAD superfamily hydrolase (TIGR01484 family)
MPDVLPPRRPQPLAEIDPAQLAQVLGLMTDIDDTLTSAGVIAPEALAALQALAAAGLPVVAITGRPLGWSEPLARTWPLAALVAENGGVALIRRGEALVTEFAQDAATRHANALRLRDLAAQLLREVPGAQLARDSAGRVTDIAIDHAEFTRLPAAAVREVLARMRAAGMQASVSSIHVNGWFGDHSKWTAAQWMTRRLFGRELRPEIGRWVYIGDSTNDELMFERFPLAVGVANLRRFAAELKVWPAYITQAERGAGFAELVRALLAARRSLA